MGTITPFLWFDNQLEDAIAFYSGIFSDSEVTEKNANGGQVLSARFRLAGQEFVGMNGGPDHPFTDAISLWVDCEDQAEVDYYWDALLAGGGKEVACGWLTDRFGLSWQVVPGRLVELLNDPDPERARRSMAEMMKQVKINIAALERAADGD
jgi:predicted 3-demethylubiquinone-9 3-methyltransferase (glyoxalase superfamily)